MSHTIKCFVLVKCALVLDGARKMIVVVAFRREALERRFPMTTKAALDVNALLIGHVNVDEGSVHRFIYFVRPKRTIEMAPLADVHCQ